MRTIKYGVLSTASIVPRFVAGVKESQHGVVEAIASRRLADAKKMAEELDIPKSYGSYEALCQDSAIDIVYIATYNKGHYEAAQLALRNRKHVLLEKPFCLTEKEANELFSLAKSKGLFIMEAQKAVFLPATYQVKELIRSGAIGKVRYIQASSSHLGVERIKWFHSLEAGGGALYGSGTYPLEYMQYILSDSFSEVTGTSLMKKGESDLQCNLSLKLGSDILATILITTLVPLASGMTVYGEKGFITIPNYWKAQQFTVTMEDGVAQTYDFPATSEFVFEVDHVNQCLKKRLTESPIMKADLTVHTIGIIEKMYKEWCNKV